MNEYLILSHPTDALTVTECAHAAEATTKMLTYKGSCVYMPLPGVNGKIVLGVNSGAATDSETEWFLRSLSGYLGAQLYNTDGTRCFESSEDNSIDGLDMVAPPEDECLPIRLFFTLDNIKSEHTHGRLTRFFYENEYDITAESDGFTIFLASNSYLDIFYKETDSSFTGEIDCTFSGAGVYAETVEIAENLAQYLGADVSFVENDGITYTTDKDFDKLRKAFYIPIRQQLAFAINDDRDGLQAYIGWGTDAFEPLAIKGTIVTPFGRYEIERLLSEIEEYGFSYVCDRRFLTRNTPSDSSDFYIKEVMSVIWSTPFLTDKAELSDESRESIKACTADLETALEIDAWAPFPSEVYKKLCTRIGKEPKSTEKSRDYGLHFTPGYMQDDISYGFGHYLRRFKLPGYMQQCCKADFRDRVYFHRSLSGGPRIEVEISYGYTGDGTESPLGKNFAVGDNIETFDIGGSSVARYVEGGMTANRFTAEAEIYIKDELYRFAMSSDCHEDVDYFREAIRTSISVEDWYDEYIREESPDPHAPGGTFCMNLSAPECRAFVARFPSGMEFLSHDKIRMAGPDMPPLPYSPEAIKKLFTLLDPPKDSDGNNSDE